MVDMPKISGSRHPPEMPMAAEMMRLSASTKYAELVDALILHRVQSKGLLVK